MLRWTSLTRRKERSVWQQSVGRRCSSGRQWCLDKCLNISSALWMIAPFLTSSSQATLTTPPHASHGLFPCLEPRNTHSRRDSGDKEEWQLTLVLSRAPIAPHDEVVNSFLLQVISDGRSDVPHYVGIMLNVITEKYQVLSDKVPTVAWIVQHTGVDGDLIISPVC